MRARSGTTALVAGIVAGTMAVAADARAQAAPASRDSAPHFALFGGLPGDEHSGRIRGFELGGSGDFRWSPIPVPLRLSLSFSQRHDDFLFDTQRNGKASLELVMRPFPRKFGIRPYFLGGLGVATTTGFEGFVQGYTLGPPPDYALTTAYFHYDRPRQTWAFASVGMGLDIGRAFVQLKIENPVASHGPIVTPVSIGFRFWD
jgi:hypothetical protein